MSWSRTVRNIINVTHEGTIQIWKMIVQFLTMTWRSCQLKMSRLRTKQIKRHMRPAKTQISLDGQSDRGLRCPHEESLGPLLPIEPTAKALIRLGGCPGWSVSSLGAQSFSQMIPLFKSVHVKKGIYCIGKQWRFRREFAQSRQKLCR